MKGDPLPTVDHISRYCKASTCAEDGRVTGAAFQLRQNEEYLSVNWLEYSQLRNRQEEIQEIRRILGSKLTLAQSARIAVMNVGQTISFVHAGSPDGRSLQVLHDPEEGDPSHSGIYNLPYDDILIAELIAEVVQATYPAKDSEQ